MASNNELRVTGEFLPDPNMCRFEVNRPILEDWTITFNTREEAHGSPLAESLFAIEGVSRISIRDHAITLTKNIATPWPELAKQILPAIKDPLTAPQPPISDAALDTLQSDPQADMAELIEQLLEQHINPALASHGGYVRLLKVEDRDVYIEMGGGCQGCAASKMTMKHGVEQAVREVCPQVREVIDATDHAAGDNPYYR